jgi:hypothetical protein
MTAKPTVAPTNPTPVERESKEHEARLDAIRADLERRAAQPSITSEEMDRRVAAWRAWRDTADASHDLP